MYGECVFEFQMCPGRFGRYVDGYCCTYNHREQHGHVLVRTPDGTACFKFCCFSRSGVVAYLQFLESEQKRRRQILVMPEMCEVILADKGVQQLPRTMTMYEKRVLRSRKKRERDANFVIFT